MKSTKYYCNTLLLILLFSSCTPIPDRRVLLKDDLRPPVFVGVDVHHQRQISLHFSEPVFFEKNDFHATPSLEVESFSTEAEELKINLAADMSPGQEYALSLTVSDAARNSHSLLCRFFGYNPRVPELLLNEITTQGSTSNPDKVELKVLSPGNTAGVVVYEGTRDFFDHYKVLPPVEVETGDYLVIHFRPSGTEDEVDERESKIECRAEDASDYGWDFWVEGGGGLSGNNGVISVYR
ncbi:MAG TPA: hypothetical protein ENN41_01430, partial [Sediminispirochaeta sp.]|nr:hypothetical protein [Sediminispirochaeta sp.]